MTTPKFREFTVGCRVRLSGKFLKSTGQHKGGEGQSVWTVTAVSGPFVVTDERHTEPYARTMWTLAEIEADPSLRFRRIAMANLTIVGQRDSRNCP